MTAEFYAKHIYNNYIFDVARILDICTLFHDGNPGLVEKMAAHLFKVQPKYVDDLAECVPTIMEAFARTTENLEAFTFNRGLRTSSDVGEFEDLLVYATDLCVTLVSFLKSYDNASTVFLNVDNDFAMKLATFYDLTLLAAQNYVTNQVTIDFLQQKTADEFYSRILLAKSKLLVVIRLTIVRCILTPVIEGAGGQGHQELEQVLQVLTAFLSTANFFSNYASHHPVDEDHLDLFRQQGLEIDATRVDFIKEGLRNLQKSSSKVVKQDPKPKQQQQHTPSVPNPTVSASRDVDVVVDLTEKLGPVKDLFPQLGDGFVEACLGYFDADPEKVINALLEENLPPHLAQLDRAMEKKKKVEEKPVVNQQHHEQPEDIAVDDEFNMDASKVHKGKRKKYGAKNANALLNDKSDLSGMRERFQELSIIKDEIVILSPNDAEYDDEYDDTYDENAMGEKEPDALDGDREFVLPRVLGGGHVGGRRRDQPESEESEESGDENNKNKFDFARNPEEIRAEAERKRQAKMARGGGSGGGGGGHGHRPVRDVVGNPKGQGQDKQVQINRSRKNANKGKHHRAMADRKQAKGMF